jgi:hypothetical protein
MNLIGMSGSKMQGGLNYLHFLPLAYERSVTSTTWGDNWQHRIIVEKLKPAEPGAVYPQFLGGERRCPPKAALDW